MIDRGSDKLPGSPKCRELLTEYGIIEVYMQFSGQAHFGKAWGPLCTFQYQGDAQIRKKIVGSYVENTGELAAEITIQKKNIRRATK